MIGVIRFEFEVFRCLIGFRKVSNTNQEKKLHGCCDGVDFIRSRQFTFLARQGGIDSIVPPLHISASFASIVSDTLVLKNQNKNWRFHYSRITPYSTQRTDVTWCFCRVVALLWVLVLAAYILVSCAHVMDVTVSGLFFVKMMSFGRSESVRRPKLLMRY